MAESTASGEWMKMIPGKPWANVLQFAEMDKRMDPKKREEYAPPNFLHPFADPDIFRKLRNDRRTREWCDDPQYIALIKELHENLEAFDEKCLKPDPKWHSKIVTSMRVLLCGKDRRVPDSKQPPPPGSGYLPLGIEAIWMGILASLEGGKYGLADKEREAGNAAYKARNYDKALDYYQNAATIFPHDIRAHLNVGAVYFETKKYTDCINVSLEAVEVGRENSARGNLIAKAYRRVGNAYKELGDLQSAKVFYEKSLAEEEEEPEEKVSISVNVTKLDLNEKKAEPNATDQGDEPINESGNVLFRKGNYAAALENYSKAIELNADDPKLYWNRAACYIKLLDWGLAMNDLDKCLEMDRSNAQGWLLKAKLLQKQASIAYKNAMDLDSSNAEASKGYQQCLLAISNAFETIDVD